MTEDASLTMTKNAVTEAVKTLNEFNKKAVHDAVDTASSASSQVETPPGKKPAKSFDWRFLLVIVVMIGLTLAFAVRFPEDEQSLKIGEFRALLTFLGFVVALASYLASVSREIVKKLSESDEERPIRKRSIAWMTTAEIQLVLLGLLIILRIAIGAHTWMIPYCGKPVSFDRITVSYLGVILIMLACLHCRVWYITKAFMLPPKPGKRTENSRGGR